MPAYRFCRTDDIPILVDALNACYHVHYADQSPMSLSDFKREIRELNIWSSSCMAAWEDRKARGEARQTGPSILCEGGRGVC